MLNQKLRGLRRLYQTRLAYAGHRYTFLRLYNGWLNQATWWPSRLRGTILRIHMRNDDAPYLVRQGTRDWGALDEVICRGEYEAVLRAVPDPAQMRTIVDLGANVGFSVRYWLRHFPNARVVAVELDDDNIRVCRANVEASASAHRTTIIRAALAANARTIRIDRSRGSMGYHITTPSPNDPPPESADGYQTTTVDDMLAAAGLTGPIDLLKCDIEGAEQEIFSVCESWIHRVHLLAIEMHADYKLHNLLQDLDRAGVCAETLEHRPFHNMAVAMLRLHPTSPAKPRLTQPQADPQSSINHGSASTTAGAPSHGS